MPEERAVLEDFVRSYLGAIGAGVTEEDGVLTVAFPPGRKRRFGRKRRLTFQPGLAGDHVEPIEPGSPLLKQLLEDAESAFGGLAVLQDPGRPEGTLVYTFQLVLYSALRKRTEFLTVLWGPGYQEPFARPGLPDFVFEPLPDGDPAALDEAAVRQGLTAIQPTVKAAAYEFAKPGLDEAARLYKQNAQRIRDYFTNLREEAFRQEARLKKRLGEIQSKLYFTEDGLREIKLEKERERVTRQLREIKHRNTDQEHRIDEDEKAQLERQRRRFDPKLNVHLLGVTVLTSRPRTTTDPPASE